MKEPQDRMSHKKEPMTSNFRTAQHQSPEKTSLSVRWLTGGCTEVQCWTEAGGDQVLATGLRAIISQTVVTQQCHRGKEQRSGRRRRATENPLSRRRCRREGRVSSGRAAEENGWSDVALVSGKARSDRDPSLQDHAQACCFRKRQSLQSPLPWCMAIQSCCSCQHLHCGPEWPWQNHCSKFIEKLTVSQCVGFSNPCVGFRLMTWNVEFTFSLILVAWAVKDWTALSVMGRDWSHNHRQGKLYTACGTASPVSPLLFQCGLRHGPGSQMSSRLWFQPWGHTELICMEQTDTSEQGHKAILISSSPQLYPNCCWLTREQHTEKKGWVFLKCLPSPKDMEPRKTQAEYRLWEALASTRVHTTPSEAMLLFFLYIDQVCVCMCLYIVHTCACGVCVLVHACICMCLYVSICCMCVYLFAFFLIRIFLSF